MIGLGTIINSGAIIIGGILGHYFGKLIKERVQNTLTSTCGFAVLFIGISGAMEGMLSVSDNSVKSGRGVFVVVCLLLGALIGEVLNIEGLFEKFGVFLREKTGNSRDKNFVEGFLNASFTVCIGAMAIVGAIQDGLVGDYSILLTKSILDLIIVMVMTSSMGKGPVFSFIPVFVLQGSVTLLARIIQPVLTEESLGNLSMVGSILIFCVGVNLIWGKTVKVANLLPAIVLAVAFAFLPIAL